MLDSRHTSPKRKRGTRQPMTPATTASCKSSAGSSLAAIQETMPRAGGPAGQNMVVWTLWLTYGAFYFCRTNLSVAVKNGLEAPIDAGGLALTTAQIGLILGALK